MSSTMRDNVNDRFGLVAGGEECVLFSWAGYNFRGVLVI